MGFVIKADNDWLYVRQPQVAVHLKCLLSVVSYLCLCSYMSVPI